MRDRDILQIFGYLNDFLHRETGSKKPIIKIQLSDKAWEVVLRKLHNKINWVDDGKTIGSFTIQGIEFVR